MILAALLALVAQAQRVEFPPEPRPHVVTATVPTRSSAPLVAEGLDSDSRLIARPGSGWYVHEIAAHVPAGASSFAVREGTRANPPVLAQHVAAARTPGTISLRLTDAAGSLTFSLTGPATAERRGNVYRLLHRHVALGRFGWAHVWIGCRRGTQQLDLAVLMHRSIPTGDARLVSAEIMSAYPVAWSLPDPVSSGSYMIEPGNYLWPAQFARPFWFSVGLTHEPERIGVADWSDGGYLPSALPVPKVALPPYDLATARALLATLSPSPSWGGEPASALWPASGVTGGSEGGGTDRAVLAGSRWAASRGDAGALEFHRIEMLRNLARARVRLGPSGEPLDLRGLPRTWSFDVGFLAGQDAPWEWDSYPQLAGSGDPRRFADHDTTSMHRRLNECWTLAYLAADPIAMLLTREGGTRAALTFGPLAPPPVRGQGTDVGGAYAVSVLAMQAAKSLGDSQHDATLAAFRDHMVAAQMLSGCFVARAGGYPSELPPFAGGDYRLQGAAEFSQITLALYAMGEDDAVRRASFGQMALATNPAFLGGYYFSATGRGALRYVWESEWPPELNAAVGTGELYYTSHDYAYAVALAFATGSLHAPEMLRRFTGTADEAASIALMRSWGLAAPSAQTSTPLDQWAALLGVLER